jgi:hypothetical protein
MLKAKDILAKLHEMSGPDSEVSDMDYGNNDYDYYPELTTRVYNGQDDVASLAAQAPVGYDDEMSDPLDGEYDDYDYDDVPSDDWSTEEPTDEYDDFGDEDDYTYDDFSYDDSDVGVPDVAPEEIEDVEEY